MNKLFGIFVVVLFVTISFSQKLEGELEIIRTDSCDYVVKFVKTEILVDSLAITEITRKRVLFSLSEIDSGISPEIVSKSFNSGFRNILIDTVSVKDSCVSLFPVKFKRCVHVSEAQYFPETGTLKPVIRLIPEENNILSTFFYISFGLVVCIVVLLAFFQQYKDDWFVVMAIGVVVVVAAAVAIGVVVVVGAAISAGAVAAAVAAAAMAMAMFIGAVAVVGVGVAVVMAIGAAAGVFVIILIALIMQSVQAFFIMLVLVIFVFLLTYFSIGQYRK